MADLCGPSNPLQRFQKHTANDRSLQQDRSTPFQQPAQGFRSLPGPDAGLVDAEFEAFQAGNPPDAGVLNLPPFTETSQGPHWHEAPLQSDWASDFQQLHLHEQRHTPIPASDFHQYAPMQQRSPGPWQHEFSANQKASEGNHPQVQQLRDPAPFHLGQHHSPALSSLSYAPGNIIGSSAASGKGKKADSFVSDDAFAQAFDSAEREALSEPQPQLQSKPPTESKVDPEPAQQSTPEQPQYRIGSDRILDESMPREGEERSKDSDADELAQIAGNLLETVKGDSSRKFQESNFLALMRQFRDREVRVEDDKIVDATQPLHPGGADYPYATEFSAQDHYETAGF